MKYWNHTELTLLNPSIALNKDDPVPQYLHVKNLTLLFSFFFSHSPLVWLSDVRERNLNLHLQPRRWKTHPASAPGRAARDVAYLDCDRDLKITRLRAAAIELLAKFLVSPPSNALATTDARAFSRPEKRLSPPRARRCLLHTSTDTQSSSDWTYSTAGLH